MASAIPLVSNARTRPVGGRRSPVRCAAFAAVIAAVLLTPGYASAQGSREPSSSNMLCNYITLEWDLRSAEGAIPAGLYFLRLEFAGRVLTQGLVVLR